MWSFPIAHRTHHRQSGVPDRYLPVPPSAEIGDLAKAEQAGFVGTVEVFSC